MEVRLLDGTLAAIDSVELLAERQQVFNFSVEGLESYLAGDAGVLVHNCPPGIADRLTGQIHHATSRKVQNALQNHPLLKGLYKYRDSGLVTQAKDGLSHRGYQTWHRGLDAEVSGWIAGKPKATPKQFERFLRDRYGKSNLKERFPNGL